MATFLVCHGAWSAGWAWKKMRPLMRAAGHELHVPTYTGLGERAHLASAAVDLELHVADVLAVIDVEDLRDLVVVGHSYGGMVATAVADRRPERVMRLVYLDAFVPRDGDCAFDLMPPDIARSRAAAAVDGWKVPPSPIPLDTAAEDRDWIAARRGPQPIATFRQPLRIEGRSRAPRDYVYCTRAAPGDAFRRFADAARADLAWRCHEIDASHSPHVTAPQALAALLTRLAREG